MPSISVAFQSQVAALAKTVSGDNDNLNVILSAVLPTYGGSFLTTLSARDAVTAGNMVSATQVALGSIMSATLGLPFIVMMLNTIANGGSTTAEDVEALSVAVSGAATALYNLANTTLRDLAGMPLLTPPTPVQGPDDPQAIGGLLDTITSDLTPSQVDLVSVAQSLDQISSDPSLFGPALPAPGGVLKPGGGQGPKPVPGGYGNGTVSINLPTGQSSHTTPPTGAGGTASSGWGTALAVVGVVAVVSGAAWVFTQRRAS